jgi:isocitrate/isopropylmalate dehydrogenase
MNALEQTLESGYARTPDLGGSSTTVEMSAEIGRLIKA